MLEKTFSKNLLDSRETGSVALVEESILATDRLSAQVKNLPLHAPTDQVVIDGSLTDRPAYLAVEFWVVVYFYNVASGSGEGAWLELRNSDYGNTNIFIFLSPLCYFT